MALCVSAGAASTKLAAAAFTLMWTHSVQKTHWQEDWAVENGRLVIVAARIEGLGAGMDAPDGATFDGHWWRWRPNIAPVERVSLRNSGATDDWRICIGGTCQPLASLAGGGDPIALAACAD